MAATIPRTGSPLSFFIASPGALGPPSPILADNIDPSTHDFVSLTTGADPIDAQVLTALSILRDSGAAVYGVGLLIEDRKILANITISISSAVQQALSTLIRNRDIEFRGVDFGDDNEGVDGANQQVNYAVKWINLRALDGNVRTATVPLNSSRGI